MRNTIEVHGIENIAEKLHQLFTKWDSSREGIKSEWEETQDFLYATDTRKTSVGKLPWSNSTTRPKLMQIKETLIANYVGALFPNENWLRWEGSDRDSVTKKKTDLATSVMKYKLKSSGFKETVEKLISDWVDFGNCFASIEFVAENIGEDEYGNTKYGYIGPKLVRHSPYDVVFNPLAASFEETPKIFRKLTTTGDIVFDYKNKPEMAFLKEAVDNIISKRNTYRGGSARDRKEIRKRFKVDGFGSIDDYYEGGYVELLEFHGDIFDTKTGELYQNYYVTVADRDELLRFEQVDNWTGTSSYKHIGWRLRPDNLWAMGPLDNLVGMQYRIDHLENLKADVMDMVAFPVMKVKGDVEFEGWKPGAKAYMDEGDIDILRVDSQALNYDTQITLLQAEMEQYAGAPREAMGIRSPGEKTAYEVQQLQNSAGRMFQTKISMFEEYFLEPIVNQMFESYRRNLVGSDVVKVIDEEFEVQDFISITKEDLKFSGKFYPVGARHFAEKARFVQEMTQFYTGVGADPTIRAHLSGKAIAKAFAESMNIDKIGGFGDNIALYEQAETQRLQQTLQQQVAEEDMIDPDNGFRDITNPEMEEGGMDEQPMV